MIIKVAINTSINYIISAICVVSCLFFMMEILFSLGTAHPAYMLNLFVGVFSHITGCICCIYAAAKSIKTVSKSLQSTTNNLSDNIIYMRKHHHRNTNGNRTYQKTAKIPIMHTVFGIRKRIELKALIALIGIFIVMLTCGLSTFYFLIEFLSLLFPMSSSCIVGMLIEYTTHIVGFASCCYVMFKANMCIKTICNKCVHAEVD